MKSLLRKYLVHLVGLWLCTQIFGESLTLPGGIKIYLIAAGVLVLLNLILKPILKLLFLPLNVATLGLFSIVINAGVFFLFMRLVKGVALTPWFFQGLTISIYHLPSQQFEFWGTLIVISTVLSIITNFFLFLVE